MARSNGFHTWCQAFFKIAKIEAQTEVADCHRTVASDKDVLGLKIAMDDIRPVSGSYRIANFSEQLQLRQERSVGQVEFRQIAFFTIFRDVERFLLGLRRFNDSQDSRVRELPESFDFFVESREPFFVLEAFEDAHLLVRTIAALDEVGPTLSSLGKR